MIFVLGVKVQTVINRYEIFRARDLLGKADLTVCILKNIFK